MCIRDRAEADATPRGPDRTREEDRRPQHAAQELIELVGRIAEETFVAWEKEEAIEDGPELGKIENGAWEEGKVGLQAGGFVGVKKGAG